MVKPGRQAHVEAEHHSELVQAFVQVPQWSGSLVISAQDGQHAEPDAHAEHDAPSQPVSGFVVGTHCESQSFASTPHPLEVLLVAPVPVVTPDEFDPVG